MDNDTAAPYITNVKLELEDNEQYLPQPSLVGCKQAAIKEEDITPSTFVCEYCAREFVSAFYLGVHRDPQTYALPSETICHFCDQFFVTSESLREHYCKQHLILDEKPMICSRCDAVNYCAIKHQRHLRTAHPVEVAEIVKTVGLKRGPPTKIKDDDSYPRYSEFKDETSSLKDVSTADNHKSPGPFRCNKCGYTVFIRYQLREHMKVVHGSKSADDSQDERVRPIAKVAKYANPKEIHLLIDKSSDNTELMERPNGNPQLIEKPNDGPIEGKAATPTITETSAPEMSYIPYPVMPSDIINSQTIQLGLFSCTKCKQSFTSQGWFELHQRKVHSNNISVILKCRDCEESFPSPTRLYRHCRASPCKMYCGKCPKTFKSFQGLRNHVYNNKCSDFVADKPPDPPKSKVCPRCKASFTDEDTLDKHMKVSSSCTVSCARCSEQFKSNKILKNHQEASSCRRLECTICQMKFKRVYFYKLHIKQHSETTSASDNPSKRCHLPCSLRSENFSLRKI